MKESNILKERIKRTTVLFKELGYKITHIEKTDNTYEASIEKKTGFCGDFFIDDENNFLEIAVTFTFSPKMSAFIKDRLVEMLNICFEYGCYMNIQKFDDFNFIVFSKIYFSGLNYYSLKDTLKDFLHCIEDLKLTIKIDSLEDDDENDIFLE